MIDPAPFLRQIAGRPARYGELDCVLALADYAMWARRLNRDPAEDFRGTYSTDAESRAVLAAAGGMVRVIARIAAEVGAVQIPVRNPPVGCAGIVRYTPRGCGPMHFGGILARDGRWAIKCSDGLLASRSAEPRALWAFV